MRTIQQVIQPILDGNFDYEYGTLDFSCSKCELSLLPGDICEGSFTIDSAPGRLTNGYVTTSDLRMECLTPKFSGTVEEISYRFHGENMEEGDVVKGEFNIVSNHGEYYIPFLVTAEQYMLSSSIGNIKNLFHFANLAKTNWSEAVALFYSSEFHRVFSENEVQYYDCYRGLSKCLGNEQNVEEFLMEIKKKQKVEYISEETEIFIDNPTDVIEYILNIVRNGWGYTKLSVETEGDFLYTEKETLTDDSFLGNYCSLPLYIDSNLLHAGKNFGRVILSNFYTSIQISVTVAVGEGYNIQARNRHERKKVIVQLMNHYQDFRLKRITSSVWLKESSKLVAGLVEQNPNDVPIRLFQGQLLITQERYNEAKWLFSHSANLLENDKDKYPVYWAYYLYLTTLVSKRPEYIERVTDEVDMLYRKNRNCWQIAWLLLYLSKEYDKNASSRWKFLEMVCARNCSSPIIYIEVLYMMIHNPAMLRKLTPFELRVLYFGAKQNMLSAEIVEQLLYLSSKAKEYSPVLMEILVHCYNQNADVRIVQEICTILIKGNKVGSEYFNWYKLGVENELRITQLYEYYMMSIDLDIDHKLPKNVLMYFSYQNNLDYQHSAFLYSYVLFHKKSLGELYGTYLGRIERFVLEQIQKEHINKHLAYLYNELLTPDMITEETAPALSRMICAYSIEIETDNIRRIIIYQQYNKLEQEYNVVNKRMWIPLYGNEHTFVFEDIEGNRYTKNVSYHKEKLLFCEKYIRKINAYTINDLPFDLYLWERNRENYEFLQENVQRCINLSQSPFVDIKIRSEIVFKLLHYLYDSDDMLKLDEYLEQLNPDEFSQKDRAEILRVMVLRGKTQVAYEWVLQYNLLDADTNTLVRLCSQSIRDNDYFANPLLTGIAHHIFCKNKYDSDILEYLIRHFYGMTKDMRNIWKAATSFEMNVYRICERILVQMLYSGAYIAEKNEVFRAYVKQGGKNEVIEAFLAYSSYDYFVKQKITGSYIFEEINNQFYRSDISIQKICKIAFLKYYAENNQEITEKNSATILSMLREMMHEGVHLNFFRDLVGFEDEILPLVDKTIVEFRSHPNARVTIHYLISCEGEESGEYHIEEMQHTYGGIFFKEFILFFGENLQYYIVEELFDDSQFTESGIIQKSDIQNEAGKNKFELLNLMCISNTLQDYDTVDCLVEEYYRKQFMNKKLFMLR